MKKIIAGLLVLFLLSAPFACAKESAPHPPPTQYPARPRGPIYTDPGETIAITIGERFIIGQDIVLRLGAKWQVSYDEGMLALSSDRYIYDDPESPGLGGTQYFPFMALKSGTTQVECNLTHETTGSVSEQKIFTIQITGIPVKEPPVPAAWWPAPVTEGILIEIHTRAYMSGFARHLTISADGEVINVEETGLRMSTKEYPPIRTTRTGQLSEAELASLLEIVDACPFDAEGNCDARTEVINTDADSELTIYYQGKTRVITADYQPLFNPFHPRLPELMDVPEPARTLFYELWYIVENQTSQVSREKITAGE